MFTCLLQNHSLLSEKQSPGRCPSPIAGVDIGQDNVPTTCCSSDVSVRPDTRGSRALLTSTEEYPLLVIVSNVLRQASPTRAFEISVATHLKVSVIDTVETSGKSYRYFGLLLNSPGSLTVFTLAVKTYVLSLKFTIVSIHDLNVSLSSFVFACFTENYS